jgi:DNA-directed RNA polymerase specialized sigma24 family protein
MLEVPLSKLSGWTKRSEISLLTGYRSSPGGFPLRVDDSSVGGGAGQFHTTRWTLVMDSVREQSQGGREALAALCQIYWYPLYAFARRRGNSPHDAQDLTQGFFLHILEHRVLGGVDRLKGKFRSFLLASFQNYLSAQTHRAHRLKRGGQCQFVSLDTETAENRYQYEPADYLTPEKIFEARWALTLLDHAMTVLHEEYVGRGKELVFNTLKGYVRIGASSPEASYENSAKALGIGVGTVKTFIHRLRNRYLAVVREEVARTVSDPAEIEGEIRELCEALISAEGRLRS